MSNRRFVRSIIIALTMALLLGGGSLGTLAQTGQQPVSRDGELLALAHAALSQFQNHPGQIHELNSRADTGLADELLKGSTAIGIQPSKVIGEDERNPVVDTTISPYRSVVYLQMETEGSNTYFRCTGAMIGPNTVLTAAHCLYDTENGFPDFVTVVPGLANSKTAPFGSERATGVWVTDEWIADGEDAADYGLVVLADDTLSEAVGWLKIGALETSILSDPNLTFELAGYPADKDDLTPWTGIKTGFDTVNDDQLLHEVDTYNGQSGSPIWRQSDQTIIGVHNGFYTFSDGRTLNYGVRVDQQMIDHLLAVCASMSCDIDYLGKPEGEQPPLEGVDSQSAFTNTWARTDLPVKEGLAVRTWMWGEGPNSPVMQEEYEESPDGMRDVQYYDKSRMEITNPDGDPNSIWYVTNGLLSTELISGNMQLGDNEFEQYKPAVINVAGDPDDIRGPTYMTFAQRLDDPPLQPGSTITQGIDRAAGVQDIPELAALGVPVAIIDDVTNHSIAGPFWQFMNSSGTVWDGQSYVTDQLFENPYFATGRPITEPYWTEVKVGGVLKVVLVQCFERRCLTFTPENSPEWRVEAGNVGQHYFFWRYELVPNENPVPPAPDVIYQSTMADWPVLLNPLLGDYGVGVPASYHIFNAPTSFMSAFNNVLAADARMRVEIRRNATDIPLTSTGNGAEAGGADLSGVLPDLTNPSLGCLVFRAIPIPEAPIAALQDYKFCVIYNDDEAVGAGVVYFDVDLDAALNFDILGLWLFPQSIPQNTWLTLEAEAIGPQMIFSINGQVVGEVEDDRLAAGQVGIQAFSANVDGEGATDTEFRNIVVWQAGNGQPPDQDNEPPAEGEVLATANFSTAPTGDLVDNEGATTGRLSYDGTYHIEIFNQDGFFPVYPPDEFGDASYTVDTRMVSNTPAGEGCLIARADPSGDYAWAYTFCVRGDGMTFAGYEGIGPSGYYFDLLLPPEARAGTNPASEWNELKIIARGDRLWYLINGNLAGNVTHGTHQQGAAGVLVFNDGETPTHWEFRDLEIRLVEGVAPQPT